jgi:RNA polymerase sigma factor (sigma-70 family)
MTDSELLQLIRASDPKGLDSLYKTFRQEFIQWIIKFSRCSREDAQEYYQAAVIILYDNIHAGKLDQLNSSLKTYLFGVGKNLAWNSYRQELRKQKAGAEFYLMNHVQEDTLLEINPKEINLELIGACLEKLGDPCHQLLDLYYYKKKSMDEIAEKLDYKNTDTAKNQKYKCMERLRKMVEDEKIKQPIA